MRILIMAGGTGGHIYPALAVAKRLAQQGHEVHWLGAKNSMEQTIVTEQKIPLHYISVRALRGKNFLHKILAACWLLLALLQALVIIAKLKPQVVLGMGGFVTGPGGLAAYIMRKRLVIHEQNAIAGMTNQLLARFSQKILVAFPQSFPQKVRTQFTGNPVREAFYNLPEPAIRFNKKNPGPLKILILGGSNGARALNNIIPELLMTWGTEIPLPMIWHQAGKRNVADTQQAYKACGLQIDVNQLHNAGIKLVDFIQDMPNAYAWADIVICRAGALTIAEIAAAGVASILVPYPYAVDDHQTKNAQYLLQAGAAMLFQERDLEVDLLRKNLHDLALDRERLTKMALQAHSLAKRDALDLVVSSCTAI